MSAWYIDTWVNAPLAVTSPTAHTPSHHPEMVVHGDGVGIVVDPERLASAQAGQGRAPAGGHQQALRHHRGHAPDVEGELPVLVGHRFDGHPGEHADPLVGEDLGQ